MSIHGSSAQEADTHRDAAEGCSRPFGIRRVLYGKVAFEVVKIVKETAQTHSVNTREWRGGWTTRTQLIRAPFVGVRVATEAHADEVCAAGNAAWEKAAPAVSEAQRALGEARKAQAAAADEAAAKAAEAGQ